MAAYRAKVDAQKARIETLEVQLKLCMIAVINMGNGGSGQVPTTPKVSVLQTLIYNGTRNTREIDNFFWKLEAYFGAVGIMASFSLKDIAPVWWCRRCDDVN